MSFDVTTLALAKSYADQHGGSGGASTADDFIIKMTLEEGDYGYTVASCDATIEQIDEAVAAEKRVIVIASVDSFIFELPMIQGIQGNTYYFGMFLDSQMITSFVQKIDGNTSEWQFLVTQIEANSVDYSNVALPNTSTVAGALDALVSKSHSHENKAILDKFAETDGKPTYDGEALGGENIIYIPAKINQSGDTLTIETSVTFEQIDTAYKSGQEQILKILWDGDYGEGAYLLPLILGTPGHYYHFETLIESQIIIATVMSSNKWDYLQFGLAGLFDAYDITYRDTNVGGALDELVPKSHTHANKDTLDKLSVSDGKLQYNGSDVGLKGDKGDTPVKGTDYWTAADKQEIIDDTLAALPTWTGGAY